MTTVNYLSKREMKNKFGMDALGYTEGGNIYIRKGLDANTEKEVRAHEFDHIKNGEEGPFLGFLAATVASKFLGDRQARSASRATAGAAQVQADAQTEAARIRAESFGQTLPILQDQLGRTQQQFDPFIQAGTGALPELQQGFQAPQGTTVGGIDEILNQIMGGDAFSGLVEERQRGVQGQLAAGGLTRSGTALKEAAAVPIDIAFQLENMLFGRQEGAERERIRGLESLVAGGRAAAGAELGISSDIIANIVNAITGQASATAGGLTRSAEAEASGRLGVAQVGAQNTQNLLNLAGTLGSAYIRSN